MGVNYLLDTHAFVWAVARPDRLGDSARVAIADPTSTLHVSAATAWELATKVRLGKFPEAEPLVARYRLLVEELGAAPLAVTDEHALRAGGLRWDHRDPFDRMLASQALWENVVLVTKDRVFQDLAGLQILW